MILNFQVEPRHDAKAMIPSAERRETTPVAPPTGISNSF